MIPHELLSNDAVQVVMFVFIVAAGIWLGKRSISQGEQFARLDERVLGLEKLMTNEYKHRFRKLAQHLNIAWDDDLDQQDETPNKTA